MKSHQYASKRRLTNICCIVVGLAFVKLVFAGYLAAGGELFAFPSPEKQAKAQQIAEMEAKRIQAYQNAALNYENSQKALADAVSSLGAGNVERQNLDAQEKSVHSSVDMRTDKTLGAKDNNAFALSATQNFALGQERLETRSGSRVSFLPQPKTKETQKNIADQNKGQTSTLENSLAQNTTQRQDAPSQSLSSQTSQMPQTQARLDQTQTNLERSDMISDDLVLASASSVTANSARAKMRASLMESAFASYESTDTHILDNMEKEPSNYTQEIDNTSSQNVATAPQSPSFFSLVGTAYAAEDVPYVRPDEATSVPLPSPAVQSYSSPDSLEYKQSELNRKEEELLALQQQMNSRLRELNELEGRIGNMVQDASSMQGEKFKHLIETYTNMKARVAAQSLVTLDEDIAVRILSGMKSKQSGEIFSYMDPVQSARLSEAMSQFSF